MDSYTEHLQITNSQVFLYYFVVLLAFIYILKKYGTNRYTILIGLTFWPSLFSIISRYNLFPFEYFRLATVIYVIYIFKKDFFIIRRKEDLYVNIAFFLFSIIFLLSSFLNKTSFLSTGSQFFFKYAMLLMLYQGLKERFKNYNFKNYFTNLVLSVLIIQVVLSIFKFFIIGTSEAIVGSISTKGAGSAVVFPTLSFVLFWFYKGGALSKKDWLLALSFFLVAFVSSKRSPVFIFPITIFFITSYVSGVINPAKIFRYIPIVIIMFYFGLRTNPSFNPEKSNWGSFNPQYAIEYALKYNFGVTSSEEIFSEEANEGRGSAFIELFSKSNLERFSQRELLIGKGTSVTIMSKEELVENLGKMETYGVAGFSSALFLTFGYLGLLFYLIFTLFFIKTIRNRKLRRFFYGFILWEIFFYGGNTLISNSMSLLFVTIILYTNNIESYQIEPNYSRKRETKLAYV